MHFNTAEGLRKTLSLSCLPSDFSNYFLPLIIVEMIKLMHGIMGMGKEGFTEAMQYM